MQPSNSGYVNNGFDHTGSNLNVNKYNWSDNGAQAKQDSKTQTKISWRRICVIVAVTIILLCILAGVAVIIAFKVFGAFGKLPSPLSFIVSNAFCFHLFAQPTSLSIAKPQ